MGINVVTTGTMELLAVNCALPRDSRPFAVGPGVSDDLASQAAAAGMGPVEHLVLSGPQWAVLPAVGPLPGAWQDAIDHHNELLERQGLRPTGEPRMKAYAPGDRNAATYTSWLWVPVK